MTGGTPVARDQEREKEPQAWISVVFLCSDTYLYTISAREETGTSPINTVAWLAQTHGVRWCLAKQDNYVSSPQTIVPTHAIQA